jgi:hypothetical protein
MRTSICGKQVLPAVGAVPGNGKARDLGECVA